LLTSSPSSTRPPRLAHPHPHGGAGRAVAPARGPPMWGDGRESLPDSDAMAEAGSRTVGWWGFSTSRVEGDMFDLPHCGRPVWGLRLERALIKSGALFSEAATSRRRGMSPSLYRYPGYGRLTSAPKSEDRRSQRVCPRRKTSVGGPWRWLSTPRALPCAR